jgi:hypothetical protein
VDLESVGCNRHLCGAGLAGSTLWVDAVSRQEMSGLIYRHKALKIQDRAMIGFE